MKNDMCTVRIKIDENALRRVNPSLSGPDDIRKWAQEQIDRIVGDLSQGCGVLKDSDYYNYGKWDITKTEGYKAAMSDVESGRVYHADSVEDMISQILG